jgi:Flp pilus assembly protein TadB
MRISNTERNEIADILSKHFAEGRLDSDEFEERVGKVMNAKTRGDLAGLLDDLPRLGPPPREPRRRRPIGYWILVLVLALFVASALAIPPHVHVPWLLIGIVALVLWRKTRHRNRWHRHDVVSPGS